MNDFHDKLEEAFLAQAKKMIDYHLFVKAMLSSLPVAIIATDKNGIIQSTNSVAEDMLNSSFKHLKEKDIKDIFSRDKQLKNNIALALQDESEHHLGSISLDISSEKQIVANVYINPLRDDERDFCGLLLTIEDQTYVNFLMDAFKRYVPPSVSEIIARDPQKLKLGGEEKRLTVLFSDLIGFTTISEKMPPQEIIKILGNYFDEMTKIIFSFQGTLKEYVADELMAIFGAPMPQPDHAKRACYAAVKMKARLSQLREIWGSQGLPLLRARVGINTGDMLVGNLGSSYRFSYGVLGDQVNLASRLEGLSSIYGTEILIGEATAAELDDEFHLREIDMVRVKGRKKPVRVFELIDSAEAPLSDAQKGLIDNYQSGLELYRAHDWQEAVKKFQKGLRYYPQDQPCILLIERCNLFQDSPPPPDWDGVYRAKVKSI